jgi:acetoacetyl-CoA synthetase
MATPDAPLWSPSPAQVESARITAFTDAAARRWPLAAGAWPELHRWSIERPEEFWTSLWDFAGVIGERGARALVDGDKLPGARWFPDARLNFAENLLRAREATGDLVFWGEDKVRRRVTHAELFDLVSQLAQAMRAAGVQAGDRVAAFVPNLPETIAAMLAAASIGAIWSSCSPDFGVQGVVDRFGQIEPKLFITADGYWYNGKAQDSLAKAAEIVRRLPSVERVVVLPYLAPSPDVSDIAHAVRLADFVAPHSPGGIDYAPLPFAHPLYILYSSGTTGVPKCIVHGAGGVLLKHVCEQQLHCDVREGDRLFYFTTCGWMMWNWLASALASGATLLLYDGSPFLGRGTILFDLADAEAITHFGTSAKFIDAMGKVDLSPRASHRLQDLRVVLSTGSPLMPEGFDYVYREVKTDVCLASISGGTDLCGCFVGGNPTLPVWRGEIQCAALGMAVEVFDEAGRPLQGEKGELVCTRAFPSVPLGFWNDPGGHKFRAAYFERFPDVWCHGDWCERTPHGGFVIYGRSDATLNPGGVRIGTAEIYRQVEQLPEVVESLVIGQAWDHDTRLVLFVKLQDGRVLDDALIERIRSRIRANTTPRHVPAKVLQVADIPRTKSGKIVELAVRNVVHGEAVRNLEALANPEALEHFRGREELAR